MVPEAMEVLRKGDQDGNRMIVRLTLPSGVRVYGFATENISSEEWDLGPTWNYVVTAEKPLLWDTGGRGMGPKLLEMIEYAGFRGKEIGLALLSHGHEDHDGGLFGFSTLTGARVMAHQIYLSLSRAQPSIAPVDWKKGFPASCWHCALPESFSKKTCAEYHREKMGLAIEAVNQSAPGLGSRLSLVHVPGHSPDAMTLLVGEEAMLVGDTILPDITPIPTQEGFFDLVKEMLPKEYVEAQQIYGLRAYLRSLKRLKQIGADRNEVMVLPSHRLFYRGRWQFMDLETRVDELTAHHINRCADILRILKDGPLSAEEIARRHFEPRLLKGYGIYLAVNEVLSHCELLKVSGDVVFDRDRRVSWTGGLGFESLIRSLDGIPARIGI